MQEFLTGGLGVGIIVGLTEVIKRVGLNPRYIPVVVIVLGLGLSFLIGGVNTATTLNGIILALTSMGLWSGAKNLIL